jgi:hypothetical protein
VSASRLRGRRGDSEGLICFNLMPAAESEDPVPVPGRVSTTRMLMVHYWRRDQQAMAEAEAAAVLETDAPAFDSDLSGDTVYVNGQPVRTQPPAERALPPQPPAYDPNRKDYLSSLKSRVREQRAAAQSGSGPLFVDESASPAFTSSASDSPAPDHPAASLFAEPDAQPAAATEASGASIFDPPAGGSVAASTATSSLFAKDQSPLSEAERLFQENLAILAPRPEPAEQEMAADLVAAPVQAITPAEVAEVQKSGGRQAKVRALESFLKRVAGRRQQIESESVA